MGVPLARCTSCGWETDANAKFCIKCGASLSGGKLRCSCGTVNVAEAKHCIECGRQLRTEGGSGAHQSSFAVKSCRSCGRPIPVEGGDICAECVYSSTADPFEVPRKRPSGLLIAGGVLLIIAGILDFANGVLYLFATSVILDFGADPEFLPCCGFLCIIFGAASLGGGALSLKRRDFTLAIVGAACGILGLGFLIGALFALLGLIFVAVSREDFDGGI